MRFPRRKGSTTSFLTATTLIYAIGAGITAAAGTRLALQLFLVKGFKLFSFQLRDPKEPRISIYCHYLPVSGLVLEPADPRPRGGENVYQEGAVISKPSPEGYGLHKTTRSARQPRRTGGDVHDHPIAPTKLLSAGPHTDQNHHPCGRVLAVAYGTQVKGPDPVVNAQHPKGSWRHLQGGSLQESW
ncbi:hypothetical protein N7495_003485 [Penicillium taxi]|nr:hypothetical protein N7495_003471 [Penicillium taxi]KAJ5902950.1 hypothetical protein N7495_003478 [Penicillium taxi]KAJ5902957.1 hypothetical protein N7495_003485 [Penicillium taxi]